MNEATSHSWEVVGQRYAHDFVIANSALRRWPEEERDERVIGCLCYGQPILAPSPGVVVETRDGVPDAPRPGTGWVDPFVRDFRGNFAIIEHAEKEYPFLAHLVPASIKVRTGDRVARGQEIGLCGSSSEPHLHFHVQDRANFLEAAGLPVSFAEISADGDEPRPERYLQRGIRTLPANRRTRRISRPACRR